MATLAFFFAISGGAAYATHELINSSDVVDNTLQGVDVRGTAGSATSAAVNGSLTGADISGQPANAAVGQPFIDGSLTGFDIANGSLGSADYGDGSIQNADIALRAINGTKVANDSLSGTNINEASLGIVPNSDKLDGIDSKSFVQGTGNIYRDGLTIPWDSRSSYAMLGVPGFGNLTVHCSSGGAAVTSFGNFSGVELDAWWLNRDGTGYTRIYPGTAVGIMPATETPYLVVLQLARAGRTATITATQSVTSTDCRFSAQAVAQIN
jgi:hypothetical protein